MRKIENKKMTVKRTEISINTKEQTHAVVHELSETNYFYLLGDVVAQPPKEGWNFQNLTKLQKRMDLQKKFSKMDAESVMLEEDEYTELASAMGNFGWLITTQEMLDFLSYIKNIEKTEV